MAGGNWDMYIRFFEALAVARPYCSIVLYCNRRSGYEYDDPIRSAEAKDTETNRPEKPAVTDSIEPKVIGTIRESPSEDRGDQMLAPAALASVEQEATLRPWKRLPSVGTWLQPHME